jgi:hypothetical protein
VWWEHVAPPAAFTQLHIDPLPTFTAATTDGASWQHMTAHLRMRPPVAAGSNIHHRRSHSTESSSSSGKGRDAEGCYHHDTGCPLVLFSQYMQAVQLGLPIDRQPDLECSCQHVLDSIVTDADRQHISSAPAAAAGEYALHGGAHLAGPVLDARIWNASVTDGRGQLVPDGSPVAALGCSVELEAMSNTLRIVTASVAALQWLEGEEGRAAFPALFDGSMA